MEIKKAVTSDIPLIHNLMIKAFSEYKNEESPSSALEETKDTIFKSFVNEGEEALIAYERGNPVGVVRFKIQNNVLYFYRLSVLPEKQGRGIGKNIVLSLEHYAKNIDISEIICKVRSSVSKNIKIYSSIGYSIFDEDIFTKPNHRQIKIVSMRKEI
jgi:ribosomal protein S18 acetylase RimI-like enzyme